jgi:hypothetical protein
MDATRVYTTEKIARILGLPEWRVVRFAQVPAYGIKPTLGEAAGPGSRRLYSLEDVCEIALGWWLVQAGLRAKVIGHVLKQVRKLGGLSRHLDRDLPEAFNTYMAIVRKQKGKTTAQDVYIRDWQTLGDILKKDLFSSALIIDLGPRFQLMGRSTTLGLIGD